MAEQLVLPIFPLPDVTFFPHTFLPLHVFETRYRAMVTDALARNRRLAVVRLRPGYEARYEGKPEVFDVAGAGEIVNCERLASGRFNILVRGQWRVRIEAEIPSDTLYRMVRARSLDDRPSDGEVAPLVTRIRASCKSLLEALDRPVDVLDGALGPDEAAGAIADRAVETSPSQFGFAAHALHLLGDIATHPDRFDAERGEAHYRQALALAEPRGMRPLVAHCHLGLGRLDRRAGRREQAREHLATATAMYREMDMRFWLEQAEAEQRA